MSEEDSAHELAWWAMRASESAFVLLRGDEVLLSNPRFDALDRGHDGERAWHAPGRRWPSLREYMVAASNRLEAGPGRSAVAERIERVGGGQIVEVQVERIDTPATSALVVALARDVTDRVRDERELALAREMLGERLRTHAIGELAPGIAHDLNNLLSALGLRLQTLRAEPVDGAALARELDVLVGVVRDATDLTARMQGVVRGPAADGRGALDLVSAIRAAAELARPEIERRASRAGATVSIEVDLHALPAVRGGAADVRHVFINLLLNAGDAMPRGGRIRIAAERRGGVVRATVADGGAGVPTELAERIFEPFFTTKGEGGSGLGLAMVRASMRRLGGSIRVRPGVHAGTVFDLEFPIDADDGPDGAPVARVRRAR